MSALSDPPLPLLLFISLAAWVVLFHNESYETCCPQQYSIAILDWMWLPMLIGMMFPGLSNSLRYVWTHNFTRNRVTGILSFLIAYVVVWSLAGVFLSNATQLISRSANYNNWLTFSVIFGLTMVWQASPWKQMCLNRCHIPQRISPFNLNAVPDCCRYGLKRGIWCVGSGWALMWLSMFVMQFGTWAMLAVGFVMFVELLLPHGPVRWKIPYRLLLR